MVHDASVRRLVDRRCAGLDYGKPENRLLIKPLGKSHYCFLDGFSRYMQIHVAPKDQHKTTFTCPFGTFAYTRMSFGLCNALSTF
ncbi:hypothetical protein CR513_44742, partial [Mucuna pruriens]